MIQFLNVCRRAQIIIYRKVNTGIYVQGTQLPVRNAWHTTSNEVIVQRKFLEPTFAQMNNIDKRILTLIFKDMALCTRRYLL